MTVPLGRSPEDLAASFGKEPEVSWSEPVHIYRAQAEAANVSAPISYNDPLYRVQPAAQEWRLAELHRISTGRGVKVAVIDSMVDATHPDLAGQVETVRDFVTGHPAGPEEHGTAVAGVIAAKAGNGLGIVGVAPQARIMGLRACWQAALGNSLTICDSLSLAKALDYAIQHDARVINMSLSGLNDRLLSRLIDVALADNAVVVAAVDPTAPDGGFPADHAGVVAVAAEEDARPRFGVLEAPGRDVPTTIPGARWGMENGSSFAAAHVSGLYALLKQLFPHIGGASAIVPARGRIGIDACATLEQGQHLGVCGYARDRATLAGITSGLSRNQALP
jgi:subtilisin family serine protease